MERYEYTATSNNMKLAHWPLMGGLSQLRGAGPSPSDSGRNVKFSIIIFVVFDEFN